MLKLGVPVYDLARGLYPVTEMPLDGSESHAEPQTGSGTGKETSETDEASAAFSEQLADWTLEELKELENDLRHAIHVKENLHTPYVNGRKEETLNLTGFEPVDDELKTRCYRSARGKVRKANKSKARPGETEVWLTEGELQDVLSQ
jgi:hypothetical protein